MTNIINKVHERTVVTFKQYYMLKEQRYYPEILMVTPRPGTRLFKINILEINLIENMN